MGLFNKNKEKNNINNQVSFNQSYNYQSNSFNNNINNQNQLYNNQNLSLDNVNVSYGNNFTSDSYVNDIGFQNNINNQESILFILFKATLIFILVVLIIFAGLNYQSIISQLRGYFEGEVKIDTDFDQMPDFWEDENKLNKNNPADAFLDPDKDDLINLLEYKYGSDPHLKDSDFDGMNDGEEIKNGFNPAAANEARLDSDKDGMPDFWEEIYGFDIYNAEDAEEDADNDELVNVDEYKYGSDPLNNNTDGDGLLDGEEVRLGLDPSLPGEAKLVNKNSEDSDNDGVTDEEELFYGLNKNKFDTDGDGISDGRELDTGSDPSGSGEINAQIVIPALGVKAPIVWVKDTSEEAMQNGLAQGVVYYPQTAVPGRTGPVNGYVTGHSSYYSWAEGNYKFVFKDLHNLNVGETFYFEYFLANKKTLRFNYKTIERHVVNPDDPLLFSLKQGKYVHVVSCYPPGTSLQRVFYVAKYID